MTTSEHRLRLDGPGELLETLPYLLGFHPDDSVVLVGLDATRLVVTARLDLDAADDPGVLGEGIGVLLRAGATIAIVAIYGREGDQAMTAAPPAAPLPHSVVAERVSVAVVAAGLHLPDIVFVQQGYWWSYPGRANGCSCCAYGTQLPGDAASGPAAAVFAGLQAQPSRRALEAVLDPETDSVRERYRAGIEAVECAAWRAAGGAMQTREQRGVKRALFAAAREADATLFPRPRPSLPSATLSRFAAGLRDIAIRDALWLAIDQQRLDGRALWLRLLQQFPAPYDSGPLFLFGWATWRDGNGTLAGMAAQRALDSDSRYTAAELLLSAIQQGLDPFRTPRLRPPKRTGTAGEG